MPLSRKQRKRLKAKRQRAVEYQKQCDRHASREMKWTTRLASVFLSGADKMDPARTITHHAVINFDYMTLQYLAQIGALQKEINVFDVYGRTPIFYVIGPHVHMGIFNFLFEHGASLDIVDNRGRSVMDYALLHGNFDVMWRLKNIREKDRTYAAILSKIHERKQAPSSPSTRRRQDPNQGEPRSCRV